jgi:putative transposase
MRFDSHKHHRRSIRMRGYDYSHAGAYFITICIRNRECILGHVVDGQVSLSASGEQVLVFWQVIPKRFANVELDEFVVMPNHVHGIVVITADDPVGAIHELPLQPSRRLPPRQSRHVPTTQAQRRKMLIPKIVGYFKMNSAKHINRLRGTPGVPVWQRNYYERVIRNEREWHAIQQYILDNPANWDKDTENPAAQGNS